MRVWAALAIAGLLLLNVRREAVSQQPSGTDAPGPEPLIVKANVSSDRLIDRHTAIELSLNRPLAPDEGRLAVVIGSTDVTDLLERGTTTLTYRPRLTALPAGEHSVVVYRHSGAQWLELGRFALKVLHRGGLVRAALAPAATLGSNGQLADGRSAGLPVPERRAFQDLTLTSGFRSSHEAASWGLETQANVVGSSRQEQALRFAQRGRAAPQVDLSDYLISLRLRSARLSVGHVTAGTNRHLANGFGSRGVTVSTNIGPATTLSLGALHGSAIVGWDHPVGLGRPNHRVMSAGLAGELVPRRPGALRVDVSLLNGSLLPQPSFTQGAVVDAERSTGAGVQLSASTPGQRIRLAGGYARSRFTNPALDPQLLGDTVVRRVRPETRAARYVEVAMGLVQNARVRHLGAVTLNTAYRHERVDPLYRSVAASTQSDRQNHALDLTGNAGLLAGQISHAWSGDNLDDVPSVLRTAGRQSTASVALPLSSASRLKRAARFLPTLSYSASRTHQLADGLPTNGAFRPQDLPNQVSLSHNGSAQWQLEQWQLGYRLSASEQDNRQPERERADFTTRVHGLTLGRTLGTVGSASVEASTESQHAVERDETSRVRRLAFMVNVRARQTTGITISGSRVLSQDASRAKGSQNSDARLELSQNLPALGGARGSSRGQLFLRYGYVSAFLPSVDPVTSASIGKTQRQWTLSSGLNVRLF
jgi:hypothetical protein